MPAIGQRGRLLLGIALYVLLAIAAAAAVLAVSRWSVPPSCGAALIALGRGQRHCRRRR